MSFAIEELQRLMLKAARKDTAFEKCRSTWRPENPLWAHCAIAAAIVQQVFGGEVLRYDLSGTKFGGIHFNNRLPDGTVVDLTACQFGDFDPLKGIEPTVRRRKSFSGKAKERCELFFSRITQAKREETMTNVKKKRYCVINEHGEEIWSKRPGKYAGWRPGKIYGRLDCKSGMRMKKENRVFFASRKAAENAGYRACKNCKP